jgi:hypothetical protein
MIEVALFDFLSGNAGVAALVGTRVFPLVVPQRSAQATLRHPCLVYARLDVRRQQKFCETDGLVRSLFQLDCYAPTYAESTAVASVTRAALIDFRGMMGAVRVRAVFLDSQGDLVEPDPGLYRVVQRFILWHDE